MFVNHSIANSMHLSDRKVSYVLAYGLGPYFHEEIVCDLQAALSSGSYFTLAFDETTTSQVKKQLDILVRFWNPKSNEVVSRYLTSLFFGHATADDILCGIIKVLETDKLPLNKLLMLSMDGPNVNLAVAKKLGEKIANLGSSELVDIGTCTLHKVHNCFSKALDLLPLDVDEFATDFFSFFKVSAARREDLKDLENLLECEEKFLLRHVSSRWVTLGPVVKRILSLYEVLQKYFLQVLPKAINSYSSLQKSARYKRIVSVLKDQTTVAYLEFVSAVASNLEMYLNLFQTEGPLIHLMHSKMNLLVRSVMLRFVKSAVVGNLEGTELIQIDIDNFANYQPLNSMDVGEGTRRALLQVKGNEAKEARMAMRSFLLSLVKLLKEALPLSNSFLKDLEKLHPAMRRIQNNNAIRRLCAELKPLKMNTQSIDKVIFEWEMYKIDIELDDLCDNFCDSNSRIDKFWGTVFNVKDKISGRKKYENLATLVKNCLSLAHGNADVERGFSLNKYIVTEKRTNLSEAAIIAIRHVKDAVGQYGQICAVPITKKLVNYVTKSHSAYMMAKEEEKKAAKENERKRALEEKEQNAATAVKKHKKEAEEKIKEVEKEISNLKEDLLAAQNCLAEGNKRLQTSIKNKDFNEMKIASTMIEASTSKVQETTMLLNKAHEKKFKMQSKL